MIFSINKSHLDNILLLLSSHLIILKNQEEIFKTGKVIKQNVDLMYCDAAFTFLLCLFSGSSRAKWY